ncbi:hypothetical protein [Paenibacillus apis]|uniref:DNA-binding protein n=1 Tax=Paenibacillus apis TaxID=1792174 RepID=A0A919Y2S7_9BACL|nr:hypothetical protein [Paenibacillus apis]GIO42278.1 hypothetical protein J41TS4_20360 [Paenibacillus apis]
MNDLYLEDLKIDSLVDLLKASYSLEEWNKMIEIADRLYDSAQEIYNKQKEAIQLGRKYVYSDRKRHIIYYFGFSLLAKGIALQNKEQFKESKYCIEQYRDLTWLNDESPEAAEEIESFKLFAKANSYALSVREGNKECLDSYIKFLRESRIDELFPGLLNIIEADMQHNFGIDVAGLLQSFKDNITEAKEYYKQKKSLYATKFFHKLSLYYLIKNRYVDAIDNTLQGLALSHTLKDTIGFKKCVSLFESFRKYASEEQQQHYLSIMNTVLEEELRKDEKSIFYDGDFVRVI